MRHCAVASVQVDLDEEVIRRFRGDLLDFIQLHGARAVVIDLSGVELLDPIDFEALHQTLEMVSLLGSRGMLAGLRPGVVAALVTLGVETSEVRAARDVDDALERLEGELA
jgi:anti-anti-sigma regulatory factor